MNTASIKKTGLGILIGVLLMIGVQFASAQWTPPPTPPTGNVAAPVNTGSFQQFKNGTLSALGLFTLDLGAFSQLIPTPVGLSVNSSGVKIFDGTPPTPGEVLTVGANNVVSWGSGSPAGVQGHTTRFDGTNWVDSGLIRNDGSKLVNISLQNGPLPVSSIFTVPTLLVSGGDVIALDEIPSQQTSYKFTKTRSVTSTVVQEDINDTPELIQLWQALDHLGLDDHISYANLQSRRITGPCSDDSFGEQNQPGVSYNEAPECSAASYIITNPAENRPYVYELYSRREAHPGNGGNNGYVEYWFSFIEYRKDSVTTQIPGGGGRIIGAHGKFSDLAGVADAPVCSDVDGQLRPCPEQQQPDPLNMKYSRHSWSDINANSSRYVFCPGSYIATAVSCDAEKGIEVCQIYPAVDGEYSVGNWPKTSSGASFATGTAWSSSGVYATRSGGEVQCSGDSCDVHLQVTCTLPQ